MPLLTMTGEATMAPFVINLLDHFSIENFTECDRISHEVEIIAALL